MGLYDSIFIEIKCPGCGNEVISECQTMQLECELNNYFKGDLVYPEMVVTEITDKNKILCTTQCLHEKCSRTIKMINGFEVKRGNFFNLWLILRGGVVTGEYIIIGNA